ncbi:hypothetical protein FAGAP_11623 [Fusarium agapanthi]|uniref:Uncharacterized protein n=1 Tax=Fusarium agapanthi TaxID=1803897 RepID=A0A9P5E8M0_9HYPO|nr:hypothetical protein FAGAP_11623 [Fusarium agapanthi]
MADSFVPPPPPPPPPPFTPTYRSRVRCGTIMSITLYIFVFVVFIVMAVVFPVAMIKGFKGYEYEAKTLYGPKATNIIVGPDVAPSSPSSETTRLLEKDMTVPSRVRRSHY